MSDHDQRFKTMMQEFFAEFVTLFFPDWAAKHDFSNIEWLMQESFPDPPEGQREAMDLVAKVRYTEPPAPEYSKTGESLTILHLEIESPDKSTLLRSRMPRYYAHLRSKHQLPVWPIALYLNVGLEGIGWDECVETYFGREVNHFQYAYVGLPALDGKEYLERPEALAAALAVLMKIPDEEKARFKAEAMQRAATANVSTLQRYYLVECIEAYLPLQEPHLAEYEHLLLTEKRYMAGREIGLTSFEKGEQKGKRENMQELLEMKFGPLDERKIEKLFTLDEAKLKEIGQLLLEGKSLKEMGLEAEENDE